MPLSRKDSFSCRSFDGDGLLGRRAHADDKRARKKTRAQASTGLPPERQKGAQTERVRPGVFVTVRDRSNDSALATWVVRDQSHVKFVYVILIIT